MVTLGVATYTELWLDHLTQKRGIRMDSRTPFLKRELVLGLTKTVV